MQCKKALQWWGPAAACPALKQEAVRLLEPETGLVGMSPVDQEITQVALKMSQDL